MTHLIASEVEVGLNILYRAIRHNTTLADALRRHTSWSPEHKHNNHEAGQETRLCPQHR